MKDNTKLFHISKKELSWLAGTAIVLMAFTFLPYVFGYYITPPDYSYSGFLANVDDHNVYMSYMRQAHDGQLVFIDQFTTEAQKPWFFHFFFLKLGLLSRFTGLSLIAIYFAARFVCGFLLLVSLYLLGAYFLDNIWWRRFFMLFTAVASGFGWIYVSLFHPTGNQPHPPDFGPGLVMPELITFMTLVLNPLFCASIFLLVCTILLLILALERHSIKLALLAAVTGIFLANFHSYDMIPLALTALLYLITRQILQKKLVWKEVGLTLLVGAISFIPIIYQTRIYSSLPVFRLKAEVSTLSPPLLQYLLALGIPFLLAIPGAWFALKKAKIDTRFILPIIWFVAVLISVYLPFPFQRKMSEGMQIPVCLLAVICLSQLLSWSDNQAREKGFKQLAFLFLILSLPSNFLFINKTFDNLQTLGSENIRYLMPPLYLRSDQTAVLEWLDKHTKKDDAVLCNSMLGSYVPGRTGARTYIGHWAETLDYPQKLGRFNAFLSGKMTNIERLALLKDNGISYIIIGPEEEVLADGTSLAGLPLKEVFSVKETKIYQVED